MEYIQRLPFILGGLAAFLTGIITYFNKTNQQEAYVQMTAALVIFFIIGLYMRGIIKNINYELEEKKKEEEKLKEEEKIRNEMIEKDISVSPLKGEKIDLRVEDE